MSENTTLQSAVCTLHPSNVQYIKVGKYKTILSLYIHFAIFTYLHAFTYRDNFNKNMQYCSKNGFTNNKY